MQESLQTALVSILLKHYCNIWTYIHGAMYIYQLLLITAVCSVCYNGGTCVAPNDCRCTGGWTGNTCNTGNYGAV